MTEKQPNEVEEYEDDVLELVDEDGKTERFYHMATLEYKGATYGVFELAEPASEEEDGAYIFSMEEDGDEVILNEVEDDEIADAVFNLYLEQAESYDDEENDAE